jgi:methionyl-tRNA formyltransferase
MSTPTAILLGSKPGSVVALQLMQRAGWRVTAVVPSGTHPFVPGESLADAARRFGLPVMRQAELPDEPVDFVISYMFRHRVTARTRELARRAALNFHAGPLPECGGWAFYNVAILEQASEYGCTCHHMDDGFDTGPLCKVRRFPIDAATETAVSLERRTQEEMILLFVEFLQMVEHGAALPRVAQDPARMRYLTQPEFERLKVIPLDADAETLDRTARAFFYPPYGCARLELPQGSVEVLPSLAKPAVAEQLHRDDYARLATAAGLTP